MWICKFLDWIEGCTYRSSYWSGSHHEHPLEGCLQHPRGFLRLASSMTSLVEGGIGYSSCTKIMFR